MADKPENSKYTSAYQRIQAEEAAEKMEERTEKIEEKTEEIETMTEEIEEKIPQ